MLSECLPTYRIYLLTFGLEGASDLANPERWRFRLEEPRCGRRQGSVGVSALIDRLISEVRTQEESPK